MTAKLIGPRGDSLKWPKAIVAVGALAWGGCAAELGGVDSTDPSDDSTNALEEPSSNPPIGESACTAQSSLPPGQIRRLSTTGFLNSLKAYFGYTPAEQSGFPRDPQSVTGFSTGATNLVTPEHAKEYLKLGEEAVAKLLQSLPEDLACITLPAANADCIQRFLAEGSKIFRRPFDAKESEEFEATYIEWREKWGPEDAARLTLTQWILSFDHLYRTEIGDGRLGDVELTQHEIAAELSFMLTDAPPDAELTAAAAAGLLGDNTVVEQHARRLLATPQARDALRDFFLQAIHADNLVDGSVEITPEDAAAATFDVSAFIDFALWEAGGALSTILGSRSNDQDRYGLLTQSAFLRAKDDALHRGLVLRAEWLCSPAPVPDAALLAAAQESVADLAYPPDATAKERWAVFRENTQPACENCHSLFLPPGLALEHYDALGQYRTLDFGKTIDPSGELIGLGDADGPFQDGEELMRRIAESDTGQFCFVQRISSYLAGRAVQSGADGCLLSEARDSARNGSELNILEVLVGLTQADGFHRRINAE